MSATWMDHNEMQFWLWASLHQGHEYLRLSAEETEAFRPIGKSADWAQDRQNADELRKHRRLAEYSFVSTIGMLLRVLNKSVRLFPQIAPAFNAAKHLQEEGKKIRDMIEHADDYYSGGGHYPDEFTKVDAPRVGMTADATSTIVTEDGHWLGGRFNVERAISEIDAIYQLAAKVPAPKGSGS